MSLNRNLLYFHLPFTHFGTNHPQHAQTVFSSDGTGVDITGDVDNMLKTAETPLHADQAAAVLFPWFVGLQHECETAKFKVDICHRKTGQIKFQNNAIAGFVNVNQRPVLRLFQTIPHLKGMEQIPDLIYLAAEELSVVRFPARKSWHGGHSRNGFKI
jgi:hypothetical protein